MGRYSEMYVFAVTPGLMVIDWTTNHEQLPYFIKNEMICLHRLDEHPLRMFKSYDTDFHSPNENASPLTVLVNTYFYLLYRSILFKDACVYCVASHLISTYCLG